MSDTKRGLSARHWIATRGPAFLVLLIPCLAGLAYLASFGAPQSYLIVNSAALGAGLLWIAFGRLPSGLIASRTLCIALLIVLALPLFAGPQVNGVARWIAIAGFSVHIGSLVIPLLVTLAAQDRGFAPPLILAAVFVSLLMPDAANIFALMAASVGLYFAWRDWQPGVVAIIAFCAAVLATVRGDLAPQPFVEAVIRELLITSPLFGVGLLLSLVASFFVTLFLPSAPPAQRCALAGALGGFVIASMMANYPTILVGYGASPIVGFALALRAASISHLPK